MTLPWRSIVFSCVLALTVACSSNSTQSAASSAGAGGSDAAGSPAVGTQESSGTTGTSADNAGSAGEFDDAAGGGAASGGANASGGTNASGATSGNPNAGASGTPALEAGPSCGTGDVSCGGDPAGTWQTTAYCVTVPTTVLTDDDTSILYHCDGLSIDTSGTTAQVTYVVAQDGSYTTSGTATSSLVITVPKACLGDQPCSALTDSASVIISDLGGTCRLSQTSTSDVQGSGTLKNAQMNSHTTSYHYCVMGDSLVQQTLLTDGTKSRIELKRQQ